jgi:hypothetical protein
VSDSFTTALEAAKQADAAVEEARKLADPQVLRQVQMLLEEARQALDRCEPSALDPDSEEKLRAAREQLRRNQTLMREVVSISNPAEFQQW